MIWIMLGLSRYRLLKLLATAIAGRVVWTEGYFGLGFVIGADGKRPRAF